ncbi:hypothetical protein Tco_0793096 [Tanacetum coccineum]
MYPPMTFKSSAGDSSSESSAGPSHKRCRSPSATVTSFIHATRALVPSRADLLPPRKRFRDSISPEDSVEEDIDTDISSCAMSCAVEHDYHSFCKATSRTERQSKMAATQWKGGNGNGRDGNGGDGNGRNKNGGNRNPNENNKDARPVVRECTYQDFMKCQPLNFKGTKGAVGLTRWFKKMEIVFHISNYLEKYQVKYATCTLLSSSLTWWNQQHKRTVGTDAAFIMSWRELIKLMAEVYCPRNEIQRMESEL